MPTNITFGHQLEEVEIDASERDIARLIELVLDNKKSLRKVGLNVNLGNTDVIRLANGGLNLEEIGLRCGKDIAFNNVIGLIDSNRYLIKFTLYGYGEWTDLREMAFDELQKHFGNQWIVTKTEMYVAMGRREGH